MDGNYPLYLIPLLPLAGAAINLGFGRRFGRLFVSMVGCGAVILAMLVAWKAAFVLHGEENLILRSRFFEGDWFYATEGVDRYSLHIAPGLLLDRLSSLMTLVITTVGFLIHLYSTSYMEGDPGYHRFFGYLNLFTGAMLILVLGDSMPVTFVGWEGVGLCSYLLIGFWYTKDANAYAGRKAFIVNRVGDFGFLLGMFMIFSATGTLTYEDIAQPAAIHQLAQPFHWNAAYGTIAALCIFLGCTGKSAQIPLYIWLPDAMAGPTPVSALIHAATMVTAGVYLVARMHFVFALDPFVPALVACVGAVTALFAATMGLTARPIKKILAYSTVSQLGFMFIGVGTRAYSAGVFHLMTHAFFKAGLFLGAGSIMHALANEEDVMKMGGLAKKLPYTRWTFFIYCLAIAGIFPFAGFFSKDAILAGAFTFDYASVPGWPHWLGHAIYGVGLVAAFCTAFYMFRAYFLVFHGTYRGDPEVLAHAHESPSAMTGPLVVLAIGSVVLGFLGIPRIGEHLAELNFIDEWLPAGLHAAAEPEGGTVMTLMLVATGVAAGGIGLAWSFYGKGISPAAVNLANSFRALYKVLLNKYYVDEFYDLVVVRPLRKTAWFLWRVVDAFLIDLVLVRGSAAVVDRVGRLLRYIQSGDVQRYVVAVVAGAAGLLILATKWGPYRSSEFQVDVSGNDVVVRAHAAEQPKETQGASFEYTFDFGDGSEPVHQSSPVAVHRYDKPGEKEIVVSVDDPRWKTSSRKRRTVEIR